MSVSGHTGSPVAAFVSFGDTLTDSRKESVLINSPFFPQSLSEVKPCVMGFYTFAPPFLLSLDHL